MKAKENPLPFFPAPYPGESLYSVFCRYHVRSGNCSERDTILQLFGRYLGLNSSVLTPFRLNYASRWYDPKTGINGNSLLFENTAYQYHCIWNWPARRDMICRIPESKEPVSSTAAIMSREVSSKKHLFYCPKCAAEEEAVYGECYWHILPQLNGVEYCPRHRRRFCESAVSYPDIKWHLIPASEYICTHRAGRDVKKPHAASVMDEYIGLASDSEWLLKNGASIDRTKADAKIIRDAVKGKCHPRTLSFYSVDVSHAIYTTIQNSISHQLWSDINSIIKKAGRFFYEWELVCNNIIGRVLAIHCQYGSAEKFYHELLEETA